MSTTTSEPESRPDGASQPIVSGQHPRGAILLIAVFTITPMLALVAAVPFAWGWGLNWVDIGLAVFFYYASGLGVTVGFHRYFTHRSFKAKQPLRIALAIAGSFAMQGPVIQWVADHRRHHAYADKEGDPHSPWLYGTGPIAVARGFWHAHMGWLFERETTNQQRFAPDLLKDNGIARVSRLFPVWTALTLLLPALLGGLLSWSWWGAVTGFFWAGLVRVGVLHHVTWAVNSICHMIGGSAPSPPGTGRRTSGRWRSPRSANPGTTPTTPTRPAPARGWAGASSTLPPESSGLSRNSAGRNRFAGPLPSGSPNAPRRAREPAPQDQLMLR